MQLPPDVILGSIEIAEDLSYYAPGGMLCDGPREYEIVEGYRLGALTIHALSGVDLGPGPYRVSHGATGILICDAATFASAIEIARAADKAVDWARVSRDSNRIGFAEGWTQAMAADLEAALTGFPRVRFETPEWGFARG